MQSQEPNLEMEVEDYSDLASTLNRTRFAMAWHDQCRNACKNHQKLVIPNENLIKGIILGCGMELIFKRYGDERQSQTHGPERPIQRPCENKQEQDIYPTQKTKLVSHIEAREWNFEMITKSNLFILKDD